MMAKESEARIRFSVFNEDYKRGLKEINDENRRMKNEFKLTEAQMKNNSSETEKLETRIKRLGNEKENVSKKIKLTEDQLNKAKNVYGENSNEAKQLGDELVKLQTSEQRLENAIDDANVELINQREKLAQADAERYAKQIQEAGQSVEDLGHKLERQGKTLSAFGRAWTMRVTAPILGAAGAALKVGMDFQEGMSQVQALTGATGKDLEKLETIAKDLGSTTRFSATEAAEAMGFLGMAGWETHEIMSGLPGVLDLAASGKLELGRAADITSNIMSAFNLNAEESSRVSDLLAYAASNANTDVEQMGEAMKYLAPVANTMNMSIEDATAAIMANSDAGIQGAMAGRTFATSLQRLANPTAAMKKAMEELNVEFFNADGQLKTLPEIVRDLETAMEGYDDKTKAATLSTLFGTEAQKNWAILLEQGSDILSENSEALANSEGSAAKMAETMQENAKGALTEFKSAAEGAGIAFAEHMLPALTLGIEKATELIRSFGDLDEEQQKQIIKWGLILAAVGPVASILGSVTTVTGTLLTKTGGLIKSFGTAKGTGLISKFAVMGASTGPVGLTVGGIVGLTAVIYGLNKMTQDSSKVNLEKIETMQEELQATDDLIGRFDELQGKNKLTTDEMLRYMDILALLQQTNAPDKIKELTDEQNDLLEKSGFTNEEMEEFLGLNDEVILKAPDTAKAISSQGEAYAENTLALKEYSREQRNILKAEVQQQLNDAINEHAQTQRDLNKLIAEAKELDRDRIDNQEAQKANMQEQTKQKEVIRDIEQQINDLANAKDPKDFLELERLKTSLALEQDTLQEMKHQEEQLDRLAKGLTDKYIKNQENLDLTREELAELDNVRFKYEEIILSQLDLNFEKGQGLRVVENQINALTKEKEQLDKLKYSGELNTLEYQEQVNKINEQISKLDTAKQELININDIAGRTIYQSRVVDVKFHARYSGFKTGDSANIGLVGGGGYQSYAKGTNYHNGGPALVGEEGPELAKYRDKYELLTFGIRNLERGTKVYTAKQTEQIFKSGRVPSYANGIGNSSLPNNVAQSLARNQESTINNQLVVLVEPSEVNLDNREVGRIQWKVVKEFMDRDAKVNAAFRGDRN